MKNSFTSVVKMMASVTIVALVGGCALLPPESVVTGPTTATPPPRKPIEPGQRPTGSIFSPTSAGNYPLFEDRRPRNVGDIVTVVLEEKTNAAKNVSTSTNRTGDANLNANSLTGYVPADIAGKLGIDAKGANNASGKGSSSADNTFSGTLTTTVIEVLSNGNLKVAGNKEMAINRGSEFVKFSGVVDPRSITATNTVSSTQVADARIEYRSKGTMDEVQTMGWMQRLFLNLSPF